MNESGKKNQKFLLDNNVFIAAIKNPVKISSSLELIIECIKNDEIELIGNEYGVNEMQKYQELFDSPSASILLSLLILKTRIVDVLITNILRC